MDKLGPTELQAVAAFLSVAMLGANSGSSDDPEPVVDAPAPVPAQVPEPEPAQVPEPEPERRPRAADQQPIINVNINNA